MTETRKLRVFLCHSSQDKPIVRELYQRLNAEGWIDPWLDEEKLLPGQDWDLEIEKAVRSTEAVIVFLSNNSVDKEGYIQHEIRLVLRIAGYKPEGTIFIIPVRLDECTIPMRLELQHYVDFFPQEHKDWAYNRLLGSLKVRARKLEIPLTSPVAVDTMKKQVLRTAQVAYLEHGKFFDDGLPSDYCDLAYTTDIQSYSRELIHAAGLTLREPLSKKVGAVSVAFLPVLGGTQFAFVQYQGRVENEFGKSTTNRYFFQTRFLLLEISQLRELYGQKVSVLPSLLYSRNNTTDLLDDFTSPLRDIGKNKEVDLLALNAAGDLLSQYGLSRNEKEREWICSVATTLINFRNQGCVNILYKGSIRDKLLLMDAVQRILFVGNEEPISFALDMTYTAQVNARFGDDNRMSVYTIDVFNQNTWQPANESINKIFEFLNDEFNRETGLYLDIYKKDPLIVTLKRDGKLTNKFDAFHLLVGSITGDYSHWFLESDGSYDYDVLKELDFERIRVLLRINDEKSQFRLLGNLAKLSSVETWFDYLKQSSVSPRNFKKLVNNYIQERDEIDGVISFFSGLQENERRLFQFYSEDILYDAIKHFEKFEVNFPEQQIKLSQITKGIEYLPFNYDKTAEVWYWTKGWITKFYREEDSLIKSFNLAKVDLKKYPSLFHVALSELGLDLSKVSEEDKKLIDILAKQGLPEFAKLQQYMGIEVIDAVGLESDENSDKSSFVIRAGVVEEHSIVDSSGFNTISKTKNNEEQSVSRHSLNDNSKNKIKYWLDFVLGFGGLIVFLLIMNELVKSSLAPNYYARVDLAVNIYSLMAFMIVSEIYEGIKIFREWRLNTINPLKLGFIVFLITSLAFVLIGFYFVFIYPP